MDILHAVINQLLAAEVISGGWDCRMLQLTQVSVAVQWMCAGLLHAACGVHQNLPVGSAGAGLHGYMKTCDLLSSPSKIPAAAFCDHTIFFSSWHLTSFNVDPEPLSS